MITIELVLNKMNEYLEWIYSELGLARWQLLIIAIAVIIVLILIAIRQRKTKVKPIHTIQTKNRSEIIGVKLSGRRISHPRTEDTKKHSRAFTAETDERQKDWGQTTKEWRKATEQIRHLKHEVTKHKRSEELLKQKLDELTTARENLQSEITERKQEENNLKQEIEKLTSNQQSFDETKKTVNAQYEIGHKPVLPTTKEEQVQTDEDKQDDREDIIQDDSTSIVDTEKSTLTNNHNNQDQELTREDIENEENSKRHEVPLDVQELKAIAELAKRLRGNNRQQQSS